MLKTTILIGDFSYCIACKFLFETVDGSKLYLCNRCNHLYEGKIGIDKDECGCWREEHVYFYHHAIKTYSIGVCAYCKSDDIEYEKGLDNRVKLILNENYFYFPMTCNKCGKKTREYYNIEFKVSEGT